MTNKLPTNQPSLSIETDPEKNKAADELTRLLLDPTDAEMEEDNYDKLDELAAKAGKAFANRNSFAIGDKEGFFVYITPTRYFKENNRLWDSFDGPLNDALPPKWGNSEEATWEFYGSSTTALASAKSLQEYGFVWSRELQNQIEPSLIKELSVLETTAEKPAVAAPKAAAKKSTPAPKG